MNHLDQKTIFEAFQSSSNSVSSYQCPACAFQAFPILESNRYDQNIEKARQKERFKVIIIYYRAKKCIFRPFILNSATSEFPSFAKNNAVFVEGVMQSLFNAIQTKLVTIVPQPDDYDCPVCFCK
jgi:hypothetical protein